MFRKILENVVKLRVLEYIQNIRPQKVRFMGKLSTLYKNVSPGAPTTSAELAALDISSDLARHYVHAGWLVRLGRGVFARPEPLELHPCLRLLESQIEGLHVGGTSALDWHGIRHHVSMRPQLRLYGWVSAPLPAWFTDRFPSSYHRLRLFEENPHRPLRVLPFQRQNGAPLVSEPERASWSD